VSRPAFEAFLARLYVDAPFRATFLADPAGVARAATLDDDEVAALEAIDRQGLVLAANSFAHKRAEAKRGSHSAGRQRNRSCPPLTLTFSPRGEGKI
jgi:hypothetical protein